MTTKVAEAGPEVVEPFTYRRLQAEQAAWARENFGEAATRSPTQALRGIVEELGEFVDAESEEARLDACGDVVIYACDYCTLRGWAIDDVWRPRQVNDRTWRAAYVSDPHTGRFLPEVLLSRVGRLCHADLKQEQRIRVHEDHEDTAKGALYEVLLVLDAYCVRSTRPKRHLLEVAEETWTRVVKKRDWKRSQQDGVT